MKLPEMTNEMRDDMVRFMITNDAVKKKTTRVEIARLPAKVWDDADLVDGLRRGEPAAAAALYDRYHVMVNGRVWRTFGNDNDAEDVAQHIFAQILSSVHTLKSHQALTTWIAAIIFNTLSKELKRRSYRRIVSYNNECADRLRSEADPERAMISIRAHQVIDKMKADDRLMFVMRFIEQAEHKEIAEMSGFSISKVKRRIAVAKAAFIRRAQRDPVLAPFARRVTNGD